MLEMEDFGSKVTGDMEMHPDSICAVVVTYNPCVKDIANLTRIRPQVNGLVVVDNGSPIGSLDTFRIENIDPNVAIIRNGRNLGLPAAMNIGMRWAADHNYEWVILFDQDSTVTDGFVQAMLRTYWEHPRREEIGIVAPLYISRTTGGVIAKSPRFVGKGLLRAAMTSGSLIPMKIVKKYGGFDERLFIDILDYEYSLRLRREGFIIVQSSDARLLHEPGFPVTRSLPGGFQLNLQNHKAERVYYIMRNLVWMTIKYGHAFPELYIRILLRQSYMVTTILLFEDDGLKKLWYSLRGLIDGARGRMGMTIDL